MKSLNEVLKNKTYSDKYIRILLSKDQEKIIPYKELYDRSLKVLGGLQKNGIKKGDELIFQITDIECFLLTFWACLLGGILPVPVTYASSREGIRKLFNIWKQMRSPYLITKSQPVKIEETYDIEGISIEDIISSCIVFDDLSAEEYGKEEKAVPEQIAYIQYSSGSTGNPKGVKLTHYNLLKNIDAILIGMESSDQDNLMSWMPLTHDMGLIGMHLCSLVGEMGQILMPPSLFIKDPILWLSFVGKYKATIISSPNFGYKYTLERLKKKVNYPLDLRSIRLVFNGAEPISYQLCKDFMNTMADYGLRKDAMFPVYGMAEASLAVSFPKVNGEMEVVFLNREQIAIGKKIKKSSEEHAAVFMVLGRPVASVDVSIRDKTGRQLEDETAGIIYIRGDSVTSGYYGEETNANQSVNEDGWLYTGDIGFITDKKIVVIGREKDVIIVNGANYYCSDLERAASLGVPEDIQADLAICGRESNHSSDELILFLKLRGGKDQFQALEKNIKAVFQRETRLRIQKVVLVPYLPKTTSGKIKRYELIRNYEEGKYENKTVQT